MLPRSGNGRVWDSWWIALLALPLVQIRNLWAYASLKEHPAARVFLWLGVWIGAYRAALWIFARL